jgi:hypothetical protein
MNWSVKPQLARHVQIGMTFHLDQIIEALHPHGRSGHFRGSGRFGLGGSIFAPAHRFYLRGYSHCHHHSQSPRGA